MRLALIFLLTASVLSGAAPTVKVRSGKATVEVPLERYVAAVLAGESSVFRSGEAMKAMAVAARTYAVRLRGRHSAEGFDFCTTTHCQRVELDGITPRLESVVSQTEGELLWWEGKPAFTPYSRDCGGRTEDAAAVWPDQGAPYLKSREDRHDSQVWQWIAEPLKVAEALRRSQLRTPRSVERIEIAQRTGSGRAQVLVLSGGGESVRISAGSFRFAIGRELGWNTVLSDRYEIGSGSGRSVFEGSGSGHGVGLCQRGADQMGGAGRSYREILAFYYPGAILGLTGRGISWQRLGGDGISVMTTHADGEGVLPLAERLLHSVAQQTNLSMPRDLEVRVYPDVETFRNATGEPGWVAAHTEGRRIHIQPVTVLRGHGALESTLRHELLHIAVESQARPGLPVWFREGLVGYLDAPTAAAPDARIPSDADLQQTADAGRARQAYADATHVVGSLVKRYSLAAVEAWLKAGLPPEVKNASNSQAATKSR